MRSQLPPGALDSHSQTSACSATARHPNFENRCNAGGFVSAWRSSSSNSASDQAGESRCANSRRRVPSPAPSSTIRRGRTVLQCCGQDTGAAHAPIHALQVAARFDSSRIGGRKRVEVLGFNDTRQQAAVFAPGGDIVPGQGSDLRAHFGSLRLQQRSVAAKARAKGRHPPIARAG